MKWFDVAHHKRFTMLFGLVLLSVSIARADIPKRINLQGILNNSGGVPLANDTVSVMFTIYDAAAGGNVKWMETQTVITDANGLFTVLLGASNPIPDTAFTDSLRWLGIKVEADPEMTPRQQLVSTAYTYVADFAQSGGSGGGSFLPLAGGTMTGPITSTGSPAITMGKGNFGSGNTNPGTHAFVAGQFNVASNIASTVGGGSDNTASGVEAVIGGGNNNTASGVSATVDGGANNTASADYSTVGGGLSNVAADTGTTVAGGRNNKVRGRYATVGGGGGSTDADSNSALGDYSTISGGHSNLISSSALEATIGGGIGNFVEPGGITTTIGGGAVNRASGGGAAIGGGLFNNASGDYAAIAGGSNNFASGDYAAIGGGTVNKARGAYSTVGGGGGATAADSNSALGNWSTVSGGQRNTALGDWSTVSGGVANAASNAYATVGGGIDNSASGSLTTIGGGAFNTSSGQYGAVGGGRSHIASGYSSTVGGGDGNFATDSGTTVAGGRNNRARGRYATVGGGGGGVTPADSNSALGNWSTVPGGIRNVAGGDYSFAAGRRAKALDLGSFVWGDGTDADFASTGTNQFLIRATGGVGIGTNSPATALTVAGQISANPGSAAVPGFTFSGDLNTGIYSPAADFLAISTNGVERMRATDFGNVGIGTTTPNNKLSVTGSADFSGNVGIGTIAPVVDLDVVGTISADVGTAAGPGYIFSGDFNTGIYRPAIDNIGLSTNGTERMRVNSLGNVGIGTTAPGHRLSVVRPSAPPLGLDRTGNDGNLLDFFQDGILEGFISVSGATVSYNAFTGSHYGWTGEQLERGELVSLTGVNRNSHDNPKSEIIYGIKRSTVPNDPACLGSYLALSESNQPYSSENPHLVMAVGNGEMWVVDEGENIRPGDYLISSSTPGHAMKDDEEKYPIGHIVARAAEGVDWSVVNEMDGGRKHKKISVLFGNFVRSNPSTVTATLEGLQEIILKQQKQIDELKNIVLKETSSEMAETER